MKNTSELRTFLLQRMENLAAGKEDLATSQAAAALAKQVNATLALELQAYRLMAANGMKSLRPIPVE